ncbi:MAG: translation initiation factor IF-2 [Candidatus Bathyarchaeia archaeon]|nr:translation initiation factor IF-2 [Candidatus Bathyarchaeota archaeon]
MTEYIRQPIVCVLGHVDVGKTTLLDQIRKTSVQAREVGGMTQHIGASFFPTETLKEVAGPFLKRIGGEIRIPGLLVIDTPGHEVFANLRRRGGSIADIAILVIDVLKGFEAQTYEVIEILKSRKTPFLAAVNKIDRIPGWKSIPNATFLETYKMQEPMVRQLLDEHIYRIAGKFSELSFRADRFDRIKDFTKTVALIPVSAKTGEGIPDLLAVLAGLTQQYLKKRLMVTSGPAKGTVLEVKEEPGLGVTINAIIYDGVLRKGDIIVLGGREKPIVTNVRAILMPKPLDEIRDPREKFSSIDEVSAAAGVKIVAPNLDEAVAGAPIYVVPSEDKINEYVKEVSEEVERIKIFTGGDGVVLKADALGSLEAIAESLSRSNIPIRLADVGDVSKRDVTEALIVKEKEPLYGVVLAFNVKVLPDAAEEAKAHNVPIFWHNVIYHLIDDYLKWMKQEKEARERSELEKLIRPAKIRVLPGFVFRRSKPAIVGIEVLAGQIRPRVPLMTAEGKEIGEILQIQDKGASISYAERGRQVAISIDKPIVGRHFDEGDILYVYVPENHIRILKTKFKDKLSEDEIETLEEIVKIMEKARSP